MMGKCGVHTMRKMVIMVMVMLMMKSADGVDTNPVLSPCDDAKINRWDGFTFGLAFSSKEAFFLNENQLSPCDSRLALATKNAQLALFRPKVDEISLLTIDSTAFNPIMYGGYMVAFAGRKYAARSTPTMVADNTHTVTNFTLVLEFQEGTLQNLFWMSFGCDTCSGDSSVCVNNTVCAVPNTKCKQFGGNTDCNLSIQLTFSGTDKNREVLNSWYEVKNLRKYSLFNLYSNAVDSATVQPQ
ncbi:CSL zinc finger domain-containing protein [Melia azedarach]|uniref:CSL zinc finger domain-containing protein n=1 Tax=Melia azedarach TaxID=155640 RepID=A0ACC1XYG1_MELAZ|nr:CSL zinc finger domain-containing protein [Melia azedarach]